MPKGRPFSVFRELCTGTVMPGFLGMESPRFCQLSTTDLCSLGSVFGLIRDRFQNVGGACWRGI